jgi:hypothetical protein
VPASATRSPRVPLRSPRHPEDEQTTAATGLLVAATATDVTTAGLDYLLALLRTSDLVDVVDLRGVISGTGHLKPTPHEHASDLQAVGDQGRA